MNKVINLIKWFVELFWPIIAIWPLHLLLTSFVSYKMISFLSQIGGGLLILYIINSNTKTVGGESLIDIFKKRFLKCPLVSHSATAKGALASVLIIAPNANASNSKSLISIEEKLDFLQAQINEIKNANEEQSQKLNLKIDHISQETNEKIDNMKEELSFIKRKVKEFFEDGISVQLFDISLMIYGAVCGYIA